LERVQTIDLSYADLRYPPPGELIDLLTEELRVINRYPSEGYCELHSALADYVGVDPARILAGNGADEIIDLLTHVWGDRVLLPAPTFGQYLDAANRRGSHVVLAQCLREGEYGLRFSPRELEEASLVWICNPNNPTGTRIPREAILAVLDRASGVVAVDECYFEFLGETVVDLLEAYDSLVVVRSFSKTFGLAGLRLGFAISTPSNIERLNAVRQIFSVNRLAARAGCAVLHLATYYAELRAMVASIRDAFIEQLRALGLRVLESHTNFVLVALDEAEQKARILKALELDGIRVLDGESGEFAGLTGRFLRFNVGTEDEMRKAVEALRNALRGSSS
jgi:histidinol-phosphate aminotransferase